MANDRIRVVVADDHVIVREGLRHVLTATPEFEVVGEAADGEEALELVGRLRPDVILMDLSMPKLNGLETTVAIRRKHPATRVLILSVHDHPEYVLEGVRAGAQGYLKKDTTPEDLREALRTVHRGQSFFSPAVARQLSEGLRGETERSEREHRLERLTAREREVLEGVAQGQTNKEIAAALGLSPRTVESYRESLMRKLEIRTVAGLTRFAVDAGIVSEER